ncbi:hypothetical protein ACS0TY_005692 [Phlomoides rotata]
MNSTELRHNEWQSNMYTIRHQWVPAYVRHIFTARMSSSQRVKSSHLFFKRYLDHKNYLIDFITCFNRALVHQRHEGLVANHNDCNEVPIMVTGFPMGLKMSSINTKKIFLLFQKELQKSMTYICTLISETNKSKVYMVEQFEHEKPFNRQHILTYHISSDLISCSCQLFEFEGYPCRHMLCWMKVMQVMMLPDKRIALARIAMELVSDCSLTEARNNSLMGGELKNLMVKVKDIDDDINIGKQHSKSREFTNIVRDPNPVRTKGCDFAAWKGHHTVNHCIPVRSTSKWNDLDHRNDESTDSATHSSLLSAPILPSATADDDDEDLSFLEEPESSEFVPSHHHYSDNEDEDFENYDDFDVPLDFNHYDHEDDEITKFDEKDVVLF